MGDAGSVHVDPAALRKYGFELVQHGPTHALDISKHLANVAPLLHSLTAPTDAGAFAEGSVVAGIQMQVISDFSAFVKDLTAGLLYTGSAAAVIATAYQNGDVESAQDISVINYAFGDVNAAKPKGLAGHDVTYSERAQAAAAARPQESMASLGMDSYLVGHVDLGYQTLYFYQDGSTKMVGSNYGTVNGVNGVTASTEYTDAHGKVVRSTATTKGTNAQGQDTTVEVETQDGQTVTTVTTTNADGSLTVETTFPGPTGASTTTTVTVHPHTQSGSDQGPVQQAEQQYGLQQQGW